MSERTLYACQECLASYRTPRCAKPEGMPCPACKLAGRRAGRLEDVKAFVDLEGLRGTPGPYRRAAAMTALAAWVFHGRQGHGGGPCTRRVLDPEGVALLALLACRLVDLGDAQEAPPGTSG